MSRAQQSGVLRVAVVGHVEYVDFLPLEHIPASGDIVHADGAFARVAGGGGVAAVVLAELGAEVDFFCALGRDANGERSAAELTERGVRVHVAWRDRPTRRAVTVLEQGGERTIVTLGERVDPLGADPLDWDRLRGADGVYVTAGDPAALAHARSARVVVATPRARRTLEGDGPDLDALVYSAGDDHEREWAERIGRRAALHVRTEGATGGSWSGTSTGRWDSVPPPGPVRDAFGCGDSFAAGLAYGLAAGKSIAAAAAIGAERGAIALTRVGAP